MTFRYERWKWFKEVNKDLAREIETVCLQLSVAWPDLILPKEEKEKTIREIIDSELFGKFKKLVSESMFEVPINPFLNDIDFLIMSQQIAGRAVKKTKGAVG